MPPTPAFRAVVFDLFHTLVDPEDFRPKGFSRVRRAAAICGFDAEDFARHWQASAPSLLRSAEPLAAWLARYARGRGARPEAPALAAAEGALAHYQDQAVRHPRTEVLGALARVRATGASMGLLSNAFPAEVRGWAASPLSALFDAACFSCALGCAKPDPGSYGAVLDRLGVPAAHAVFVGDGLGGELAGAKAAGFGRVALMTGFIGANGLRTPEEMAGLRLEADTAIARLDAVSAWLAAPAGDAG